MDREDSGVIDLFAIHARTKRLESMAPPPPATQSAPPAAVAMDVDGSSDVPSVGVDGLDIPFASAKSRRKPIFIGLGVVSVLAVFGIVALSGGDDGAQKAAAAAAAQASAAPPPPPAPVPPPAVVEATASPSAVASAAPPATAKPASVVQKPVAAARPTPRPASAGGPKLMKVQSTGVP
jgi:hypothetical protein